MTAQALNVAEELTSPLTFGEIPLARGQVLHLQDSSFLPKALEVSFRPGIGMKNGFLFDRLEITPARGLDSLTASICYQAPIKG